MTVCIGKYVYFPNLNNWRFIKCDTNCTPILFYNNSIIAYIQYQNSEFVVYQNGYRCGVIIGNISDLVWQFVPDSMIVPQNIQYQAANSKNTNSVKYTFNNVPSEQAKDIIDNITKNNPSFPVEINFAPSSANISQQTDTSSSSDIIDISPNGTDTSYK